MTGHARLPEQPLRLLVYCAAGRLGQAPLLGTADYSYHFVMQSFLPALQRFAQVQEVDDPEREVDALWQQALAEGQACLLLCFAPPHRVPAGLRCPTLPVFAWEYPNLPEGWEEASWNSDPRHDWRRVLLDSRAAIVLSQHTAQAVHDVLGVDFPVLAVPTPLWDAKSLCRDAGILPSDRASVTFCVHSSVFDSAHAGLSADGLIASEVEDDTPFGTTDALLLAAEPPAADVAWPPIGRPLHGEHLLPGAVVQGGHTPKGGWTIPPPEDVELSLRGVIYTTVLTPADGRKNWEDIVTAFGWAFRDVADATLVLKLGGPDTQWYHQKMLMLLTKLSPLKCRVVALHGYLGNEDYDRLIAASTYYVNASLCEGLCMPLMEFLSCGVPAIAPDHTAMADYIDDDLAFVVRSLGDHPAKWPHGDFQIDRTTRPRMDWHALMQAFRDSFLLARDAPERYRAMSAAGMDRMASYASVDNVSPALGCFLHGFLQARRRVRESVA